MLKFSSRGLQKSPAVLTASLWTALMLSAAICGCTRDDVPGKEPDTDPGEEPGIDPGTEQVDLHPVAREGWDIYTGENYRYGPSIIINDDSSIDIWLATPGDYHGTNVMVPEYSEQVAAQLGTENTFAQRFTMAGDFGFISLQCPSWGSGKEGFTLKLYVWKGDYAGTVAGEPLASRTFVNYEDNSWLSLYSNPEGDFTKTFPAGTYLWEMSAGTESSGIYKCPDSGSTEGMDAVSYVNGSPVDGQFRCRITSGGSGNYFWDKITWRHSVDGGVTWTDEADALLPSDGRRDAYSVCDPGVAKWGGYYYIAYTSTENPYGYDNDVYVARGASPTGPWEKWSGDRWGDDPQPVIDYDGDPSTFGAGEPCIVVLDGTVYLYYSWNDLLVPQNRQGTETRLSTASADDADWPAHLEYKGVALTKNDVSYPDHSDIKYVERSRKFFAIYVARRNSDRSRFRVLESADGLNFTLKEDKMEGELRKGMINAGMSGDAEGHVRPGVQQYLSYAYSEEPRVWGRWFTWFQPLDWVEVQETGDAE